LTALWHPQANMSKVVSNEWVLTRGEGAYIWDEAGRRLFDAPASLWYCNVGHGRAEIADAVAGQIRQLESYSNFENLATRPTLDLAERLASMVPLEDSKIFFTSGGSDAIDTAAKLVRRYWSAVGHSEKRSIVTRELAYHGLHAFGTSITGLEANRDGFGPLVEDTCRVATNDVQALEALFASRGPTIAAFFCEPIIGTGGVVLPAPGYLRKAQELCAEYDILFVLDEVITGFGRTGELFAANLFGLQPDLLILAKGITSGYLPLGGVAVNRRVWDPFFAPGSELVFRHGLTYSGHATACAAAMANLDILENERLVARGAQLAPLLHQLARNLANYRVVTEVRTGIGLLAGIQLTNPEIARAAAALCREGGVMIRVITNGTLQLSPPFVTDESDLRAAVGVLREALEALDADGTGVTQGGHYEQAKIQP
jgi:putrescine aminotransferase